MTIHVQTGMDKSFFEDRIATVLDKINGLDGTPVDVVVIDNPQQCRDIFDQFDINDQDAFIKNCQDALTSISYRAENQEIIVIKADKPFIKENEAALRGLLAHELMHVVHRHNGIEDTIQDAAKEYTPTAINELRDIGMNDQEIGGFIGTVFATAIFCLKDIYANTDLIKQGFAEDVEEYYHNMLGINEYCRVPDFYGSEATLADVENALAFELGLLPAWIPFHQRDQDSSARIRSRIQDCYERDIPHVANHLHDLTALYQDAYGDDDFNQQFFEQVLSSSKTVLQKKLDTVGYQTR